jgi:hypothetical protein
MGYSNLTYGWKALLELEEYGLFHMTEFWIPANE